MMCYFTLQIMGRLMSKRVLFVDLLLFRRFDISSIVYEPDMAKRITAHECMIFTERIYLVFFICASRVKGTLFSFVLFAI